MFHRAQLDEMATDSAYLHGSRNRGVEFARAIL